VAETIAAAAAAGIPVTVACGVGVSTRPQRKRRKPQTSLAAEPSSSLKKAKTDAAGRRGQREAKVVAKKRRKRPSVNVKLPQSVRIPYMSLVTPYRDDFVVVVVLSLLLFANDRVSTSNCRSPYVVQL
jgi:hypothetical protein